MGAAGQLGRQTWRGQPDRAPPDAADGAFLADPLPQILTGSAGTSVRAGRFPGMQMKHSLLISCALFAASGAAFAQAPPMPATPPAQTAPPSPARSTECTPTQSR